MNTHGIRRQYARNTHGNTHQRIRILSEYVFCAGISLVLVWLARVLREEHFSAFLHVVYSVCILCVFSCILENTVYSALMTAAGIESREVG